LILDEVLMSANSYTTGQMMLGSYEFYEIRDRRT
jgi:hypothetical protein